LFEQSERNQVVRHDAVEVGFKSNFSHVVATSRWYEGRISTAWKSLMYPHRRIGPRWSREGLARLFSLGGCLLGPPSPPAEKPTASEDQAGEASTRDRTGDRR